LIRFIERLEQHEQAMVCGAVQHPAQSFVIQHRHDEKHTAGTSPPGFENLHRVDQEILAHDRRIGRRRNHFFEMRERTIKAAGFRQNRDRGRTAARVLFCARGSISTRVREVALSRRSILDLGDNVEFPKAKRHNASVECRRRDVTDSRCALGT
jgi:hypothetical protein